MNLVRPVWIARQLNPDAASVWFVGREGDDGPLEMVELERLAEGLPYLVPSWWTSTWGPFSKRDAQAIVAGRKRTPGAESVPGTRFEGTSSSDERDARVIDEAARTIGQDAARAVARQIREERRARQRRPRSPLARAIQFFYRNAGYSYDPARGETRQQGRRRTARLFALAERYAREQGWELTWENDDDPDLSWMTPEQQRDVESVEVAFLRDAEGNVLESLGGIVDADETSRRLTFAELALSAMPDPETALVSFVERARPRSLENQILHEIGQVGATIRFLSLTGAKALRRGDEIRVYDLTCRRHEGDGGCWKRVRVSGRVKTWARDGSRVSVPLKYGLRDTFRFTEREIARDLAGIVA